MGRLVAHRGTRGLDQRRLAVGAVLAWLAVVATVGLATSPAHAAGIEHVTITGIGLTEPLEVAAETSPELCAALYREVSWLVGDDPDAEEPDPDTLGPQYTLVAHLEGEPRHRFHLYPLAEGGPRVFRPTEQPGDREAEEGWFLGRVGMPETLAAAGVPLEDPIAPSGAGGGEVAPEATAAPETSAFGFLDDWRQGMQLTAAVTLAIVAGLGAVALLIRRKV